MKLLDIINEHFRETETVWFWVSPNNETVTVPKLRHKEFIMSRYPKLSWDYDIVFEQAIKDGWVRGIYEYNPRNYIGELSLNGHDKDRVISVLKTLFKDFIKYGYKSIYIDYENPQGSNSFSTFDKESTQKLIDFLNS